MLKSIYLPYPIEIIYKAVGISSAKLCDICLLSYIKGEGGIIKGYPVYTLLTVLLNVLHGIKPVTAGGGGHIEFFVITSPVLNYGTKRIVNGSLFINRSIIREFQQIRILRHIITCYRVITRK